MCSTGGHRLRSFGIRSRVLPSNDADDARIESPDVRGVGLLGNTGDQPNAWMAGRREIPLADGSSVMLAALVNVPANLGYPLLGVLVAAEAAGAFVPGETSLIVAATLAAQGRLTLSIVIAVAAGAAIIGDNIGYQLGRHGLRKAVEGRSLGRVRSAGVFARGEAFFQRHGRAAVFFGRWLPGLRVLASWLAGANRMPWRSFLFWNALGGIGWATTVGTAAYLLGRKASGFLLVVEAAAVTIVALVYIVRRKRERS
jgi:membrane protein DedA with SNARE-associated domain